MSLNIKNESVIRLTDELATLMGTTKVAALESALVERIQRVREATPPTPVDRRALIERDLEELRRLLAGGPARTEIDRELYDERGLPR